LFSIFHKQVVA